LANSTKTTELIQLALRWVIITTALVGVRVSTKHCYLWPPYV